MKNRNGTSFTTIKQQKQTYAVRLGRKGGLKTAKPHRKHLTAATPHQHLPNW